MFLTNIHLKTDKRDQVINTLKEGDRIDNFFVSPVLNGWVSVYDEAEIDNTENVYDLASELSGKLGCKAIVFDVYDSDICKYQLYDNGAVEDKYNSNPDYFEPVSPEEKEQLKGKPKLLLPLCLQEVKVEDLRKILDDNYPSEEKRVEDLAKTLGIKNAACSYNFLQSEGTEQTVGGWKDFWDSLESEENQGVSESQ